MAASALKKLSLAAAAAALAFGALPAEAGGKRHYGKYGKGHSHVVVHHHWSHGHYKPRRHYYYGHHHRRGLSGGEAAVIAAAIIGGAILIDGARDRRRYDDRYYGGYDDRYAYRPAPSRQAERYYYRRDDAAPAWHGDDDDGYGYDDLLGGAAPAGPNTTYNYGAAYNDCKAETRAAASQGGLHVALPAKPQRITPIEGGEAVRFTADLIASDRRGGEARKMMICEADINGVRFLELV